MSKYNKLLASASPQKLSKNDVSLSVEAFGGVRNGDRMRASGHVIFFHIVQFGSSNGFIDNI